MSRVVACLALLLAACAGAPKAPAPNANELLVGVWANGEPGAKCMEQFEFRADGTLRYASGGGARMEGQFELSANPSARGMRVLIMQAGGANGGKDCSGDVREGGAILESYIWIDPGKDLFLACAEDSFSYCDIPMRRVRNR
jgi:hypothetical protein